MIDVIIPAYNAHDTIANTLRSLAIQRLAKHLDILIIDDGSTRGYEKEISLFTEDFKSIKQIRFETNRGVGYCRQVGLSKSSNPHIYFIDSDDVMVNPYTFNYFMNEALSNPDYAVIYGDVIQETQPNTSITNSYYEFKNDVNIYTDLKGNRLFLHGKLYSRKFISKNKLRFIELRSNEDIGFNTQVFTIAQPDQVKHLSIESVSTLCNNKSITRNPNSTRKWNLSSVIEAHDGYLAMLQAFNIVKDALYYDDVEVKRYNLFIQRFLSLYMRYCHGRFDSEERRELFRLICAKYYRDIVTPIIDGTKYLYVLPNKWETNDFAHYMNPTEDAPHPEINGWIKRIVQTYSEDRFKYLYDKYITSKGYTY